MNALSLFTSHADEINDYLLLYTIIIFVIGVVLAFAWRFNKDKSFLKSIFISFLILGTLLGGSAMFYRINNMGRMQEAELNYKTNRVEFEWDEIRQTSDYEAHFQNLFKIWMGVVVGSLFLMIIFRKRQNVLGFLSALIILSLLSLSLDYAGYRSDKKYYYLLQQISKHVHHE
jgi:disulfide bond formation protein DsbB